MLLRLGGEREQLRAGVAREDVGDLGSLRLERQRPALGEHLRRAQPCPLAGLRPREHHVDGRGVRHVRPAAVRTHQQLDAGIGAQRRPHAIELVPVGGDRGVSESPSSRPISTTTSGWRERWVGPVRRRA